jgi:hypothetical protein
MNIYDIITTIHEDWSTLVFVFALGAAWWQGKHWFAKVTSGLDKALIQHDNQNNMLEHIQMKTDLLEERSDKIESIVNEIHDKLHEQEVKLAVLESVTERKIRSTTK